MDKHRKRLSRGIRPSGLMLLALLSFVSLGRQDHAEAAEPMRRVSAAGATMSIPASWGFVSLLDQNAASKWASTSKRFPLFTALNIEGARAANIVFIAAGPSPTATFVDNAMLVVVPSAHQVARSLLDGPSARRTLLASGASVLRQKEFRIGKFKAFQTDTATPVDGTPGGKVMYGSVVSVRKGSTHYIFSVGLVSADAPLLDALVAGLAIG